MTTTKSIKLGDGYVVLTTGSIMQQCADWLVVGVPYGVANLRESSIFQQLAKVGCEDLCQQLIGVYNNFGCPNRVIETIKYGTSDVRFSRVFFVSPYLVGGLLLGGLLDVMIAARDRRRSVAISLDVVFDGMSIESLTQALPCIGSKEELILAGTDEQVEEIRRAMMR